MARNYQLLFPRRLQRLPKAGRRGGGLKQEAGHQTDTPTGTVVLGRGTGCPILSSYVQVKGVANSLPRYRYSIPGSLLRCRYIVSLLLSQVQIYSVLTPIPGEDI